MMHVLLVLLGLVGFWMVAYALLKEHVDNNDDDDDLDGGAPLGVESYHQVAAA